MSEPNPPSPSADLAARPRVRRREVLGYSMFDFANSSFTTLISTVAYSAYFREAVVGGEGNRGDFLWSVATVPPTRS